MIFRAEDEPGVYCPLQHVLNSSSSSIRWDDRSGTSSRGTLPLQSRIIARLEPSRWSKLRHTSRWDFSAARCRAVLPSLSCTDGLAFRASRILTISMWPVEVGCVSNRNVKSKAQLTHHCGPMQCRHSAMRLFVNAYAGVEQYLAD